jgi:hypothetical protein
MAATNGTFDQQEQYKNNTEQYTATTSAAETASGNANGSAELSKDEIGWYFVEQYYTTLSKSPEKLHVCSSTLNVSHGHANIDSFSTASARSSSLVLRLRLPQSLSAVL